MKEENYEHVLMCLICRSLFDDHDHQPKFLPCHHTFCKDCLREYVRQTAGDEIECPSCRKVATIPAAGVAALQTNFYAKYIQSLVYGSGVGGDEVDVCAEHKQRKTSYCHDCAISICDGCLSDGTPCTGHRHVPLTTVTEQLHQRLDASFADANALIERKKMSLETMLKALAEEKDQSLLKIDATFEQHVHTLTRRATLLKNKVIDVYNDNVKGLDADLEEISTAMTCIVSLKEYHETKIGHGEFTDVSSGIEEMCDVHRNIRERIRPTETHIVFEDKHGVDKFRACAKDLGRVTCSQRSPPKDASENSPTSPNNPSECDFPPEASPDGVVSAEDGNLSLVGEAARCLKYAVSSDEHLQMTLSVARPKQDSITDSIGQTEIRASESLSCDTTTKLHPDLFAEKHIGTLVTSSVNNKKMVASAEHQVDVHSSEENPLAQTRNLERDLHDALVEELPQNISTEESATSNKMMASTSSNSSACLSGTTQADTTKFKNLSKLEQDTSAGSNFARSTSSLPHFDDAINFGSLSATPRLGSNPVASGTLEDTGNTGRGATVAVPLLPRRYIVHGSYDEQHLLQELGYDSVDRDGNGNNHDAASTRQMSQSDFWVSISSSIESNLSDHDVIVAELSGEQTSL